MSLIRGCRRCEGMPLPTTAAARGPDGEDVIEIVHLCQPCRIKAGQENAIALARRTGKDATK